MQGENWKKKKAPPPEACMRVYLHYLSLAIFWKHKLIKGCHFGIEKTLGNYIFGLIFSPKKI